MSFRKILGVMVICFAGLAFMTGPAVAAEFTMKLGLSSPPTDFGYQYRGYALFKDLVENNSGGRIEVKIYPSNQLGRAGSLVKQAKKGVVQGLAPSAGILASHFAPIQVLYTPYVFPSEQVAWAVMDGPFGDEVAKALLAKTGLRMMTWNENGGFRNFVSAKKVLLKPGDLKGMKIRTEKVRASMGIAGALGGNPTPMAVKELYTSMQTGVVDGMEMPVNTFLKFRLEEVSKSMIMDGHVYSFIAFMCNDKWYQSLGPELQGVVNRAALISRTVNRGLSRGAESLGIAHMRKKGMTVTFLTPRQKAAFIDTARPAVEKQLRKEIGDQWVDGLLKAVDQTSKELGLK
jgi:tripartite ATP-independent transporter DctP family solute receptor